jgi:pre-mRNA 3'-end-processing factor FIP1
MGAGEDDELEDIFAEAAAAPPPAATAPAAAVVAAPAAEESSSEEEESSDEEVQVVMTSSSASSSRPGGMHVINKVSTGFTAETVAAAADDGGGGGGDGAAPGVAVTTSSAVTTTTSASSKSLEMPRINEEDERVFGMDLDALGDKPWRRKGADLTDWFNYGLVVLREVALCCDVFHFVVSLPLPLCGALANLTKQICDFFITHNITTVSTSARGRRTARSR